MYLFPTILLNSFLEYFMGLFQFTPCDCISSFLYTVCSVNSIPSFYSNCWWNYLRIFPLDHLLCFQDCSVSSHSNSLNKSVLLNLLNLCVLLNKNVFDFWKKGSLKFLTSLFYVYFKRFSPKIFCKILCRVIVFRQFSS